MLTPAETKLLDEFCNETRPILLKQFEGKPFMTDGAPARLTAILTDALREEVAIYLTQQRNKT